MQQVQELPRTPIGVLATDLTMPNMTSLAPLWRRWGRRVRAPPQGVPRRALIRPHPFAPAGCHSPTSSAKSRTWATCEVIRNRSNDASSEPPAKFFLTANALQQPRKHAAVLVRQTAQGPFIIATSTGPHRHMWH